MHNNLDQEGEKLNRYGVPISQGLLGKPRAQRRASVGGKWTAEEDASLKEIVELHGAKNWKKVGFIVEVDRNEYAFSNSCFLLCASR